MSPPAILLDVNLLLAYGWRSRFKHEQCRLWLDSIDLLKRLPECRAVPTPEGAGGIIKSDVNAVRRNVGLICDGAADGLTKLFCLFGGEANGVHLNECRRHGLSTKGHNCFGKPNSHNIIFRFAEQSGDLCRKSFQYLSLCPRCKSLIGRDA